MESKGVEDTSWHLDCYKCPCKEKFRKFQGHESFVESCDFSPDSLTISSCSGDETIRLWSVENGKCIGILTGHKGIVWRCSFNASGNLLCSCSSDKTVRIWCVLRKELLVILEGHTDLVWDCKFSPSGNSLASASSDDTIKLWSLENYKCVKELGNHINTVECIQFSPSGEMLVSCSHDMTIKFWRDFIETTEATFQSIEVTSRALCCSFSSCGNKLATGHADASIRIYNVDTLEVLNTLKGHSNIVWACEFAIFKCSEILVTSSSDRSIRFWEPYCGYEIKIIVNLDSDVNPIAQLFHVTCSHNAEHVAATGYDNNLYIANMEELLNDAVLIKVSCD